MTASEEIRVAIMLISSSLTMKGEWVCACMHVLTVCGECVSVSETEGADE